MAGRKPQRKTWSVIQTFTKRLVRKVEEMAKAQDTKVALPKALNGQDYVDLKVAERVAEGQARTNRKREGSVHEAHQ
jgi:hypothetical protein